MLCCRDRTVFHRCIVVLVFPQKQPLWAGNERQLHAGLVFGQRTQVVPPRLRVHEITRHQPATPFPRQLAVSVEALLHYAAYLGSVGTGQGRVKRPAQRLQRRIRLSRGESLEHRQRGQPGDLAMVFCVPELVELCRQLPPPSRASVPRRGKAGRLPMPDRRSGGFETTPADICPSCPCFPGRPAVLDAFRES